MTPARARRYDRLNSPGLDELEPMEVDREELVNEKDRHVLRAAVYYEADFVITSDMGLHAEINRWASESSPEGPKLWGGDP